MSAKLAALEKALNKAKAEVKDEQMSHDLTKEELEGLRKQMQALKAAEAGEKVREHWDMQSGYTTM